MDEMFMRYKMQNHKHTQTNIRTWPKCMFRTWAENKQQGGEIRKVLKVVGKTKQCRDSHAHGSQY